MVICRGSTTSGAPHRGPRAEDARRAAAEGVDGGGTRLGEGTTSWALYPLDSEYVVFTPASAPSGLVYAVVDDGGPAHAWRECREGNNQSAGVDPTCP